MSGYQVTNTNRFAVGNPQLLISSNIQLAQSTVVVPQGKVVISNTDALTADALLGGYIILNTGAAGNALPNASDILTALRLKLAATYGLPTFNIPNGTRFSCTLYNLTETNITIVDSDNGDVYFNETDGVVGLQCGTVFTFVVNTQTALGDASDWISVLNADY